MTIYQLEPLWTIKVVPSRWYTDHIDQLDYKNDLWLTIKVVPSTWFVDHIDQLDHKNDYIINKGKTKKMAQIIDSL